MAHQQREEFHIAGVEPLTADTRLQSLEKRIEFEGDGVSDPYDSDYVPPISLRGASQDMGTYCLKTIKQFWEEKRTAIINRLESKDNVVALGDRRIYLPGHCYVLYVHNDGARHHGHRWNAHKHQRGVYGCVERAMGPLSSSSLLLQLNWSRHNRGQDFIIWSLNRS
uniref:Uncharacterized protein n=1 Tax=Knipowitschia caucasica TaxID=637954 RepID=A0AAV2JHH2_KNICA